MIKFVLAFIVSMGITHAELLEAQCEAIPSSKRYIDFPSQTNYPKMYKFTCDFRCIEGSKQYELSALHQVEVHSLTSEARDVVCYGVKVKRVSWGYDFDRVEPFFVYAAGLESLSDWAKSLGVSPDHSSSAPLMNKLVKDLEVILPSYQMAGNTGTDSSRAFAQAAQMIEKLLNQLPASTEYLDELVSLIPKRDISSHNGLNLVLRTLQSSAAWRVNAL
ncbi:hypothetical protein [Halobacteriovorax marinus]|uniref:hypothetical protein n=1 Tax=Halobacteriovorax marinus TaxID=97084 RepID=UPI003A9431FD